MRFLLLVLSIWILYPSAGKCDSWKSAQQSKKAKLDVHWYTSIPFIFQDATGNLTGLEYELVECFARYVEKKHGIDLQINWFEESSFSSILDTIRVSTAPNQLGTSAFSITKDRQRYLQYTDAYLPDITVLVSSQSSPIVRNFDEINSMMQGMTAITIKGTIYETLLLKMREQINVDFDITYIDSDDNVLQHISKSDKVFGFIDLPIYLMWIKDGRNLTRQNFFTVRGKGYGIIMPKSSDWNIPFNQFLTNAEYKEEISSIVSKHLGDELYQFIEESYDREQLGSYILTKEKEIQLALIKNANLKLEKEKTYKRILILGIAVVLLFLISLIYYFKKNQRTTQLIIDQKNQIEAQQHDIRLKNEQLINRNAQLLALNEDKNNLVSILAHDLRSPLSNIIGLSGILLEHQEKISEEEKDYVMKIGGAAQQMNQMIIKILDVGSLERDQKTVLKETVSVNQLINDLVIRYQLQSTNKNIAVSVKLPEHDLTLETDHMLLFLILENLLSNAVKFSPSGSKISIGVIEDADEIIIKIRDQGPGFTDEDKPLVFNKFQKLSARPTGNESSTGLGLSIVKKYVTDLGGKVWLESETGKGSTFYVSLKSVVKIPQETD
ncbi:MAG: ATP-binding protein [Reichenbachiella sp.]|uniref:ATP-binding protein n=1 Tax=Reichenbachiella sp. TaxID=2184521 RepID=UPI00326422B0